MSITDSITLKCCILSKFVFVYYIYTYLLVHLYILQFIVPFAVALFLLCFFSTTSENYIWLTFVTLLSSVICSVTNRKDVEC